MKVVVLSATEATEAALEALADDAENGFEETCTEVSAGEAFSPAADACYELVFDDAADDSTFTITAGGPVAIFTQHMPTEFGVDYLTDDQGRGVQPSAVHPGCPLLPGARCAPLSPSAAGQSKSGGGNNGLIIGASVGGAMGGRSGDRS